MLDAKPLDALEAIVRAGSFELAAQWLCITPSAVSQRIRQLEEHLGQTVLVRSQPVRPTPAGKRLLRHVRQLQLLEAELRHDLAGDVPDAFTTLAVAVNAVSLETWFPEAIADCVAQENLLLQLIVDDQDYTHALLKNGDVIGCVTTQAQALTGCQSVCLGRMPYVCVATQSAIASGNQVSSETALTATASVVKASGTSPARSWRNSASSNCNWRTWRSRRLPAGVGRTGWLRTSTVCPRCSSSWRMRCDTADGVMHSHCAASSKLPARTMASSASRGLASSMIKFF
jgi:DNA-binding transcriptional LysR family regulator